MGWDDIEELEGLYIEKLYRGKLIDCFYKDCLGFLKCESYDYVQKTVYGTFTHYINNEETHEVIEESINAHIHIDDLSRSIDWCYKWVWYDDLQYHIGKGTVIRLIDNRHFTCGSFNGQKVYGIITDIDGSVEWAELELHEIEKMTDPSCAFYEIKIPYVIELIWDYEVNNKTEDIIGWMPCATEIECIIQYLEISEDWKYK